MAPNPFSTPLLPTPYSWHSLKSLFGPYSKFGHGMWHARIGKDTQPAPSSELEQVLAKGTPPAIEASMCESEFLQSLIDNQVQTTIIA
eukprot:6228372-Amphidinium_carterae.1